MKKIAYTLFISLAFVFGCHDRNSSTDSPAASSSIAPEKMNQIRQDSYEYAKLIRDNSRIKYLLTQFNLENVNRIALNRRKLPL